MTQWVRQREQNKLQSGGRRGKAASLLPNIPKPCSNRPKERHKVIKEEVVVGCQRTGI